jgi:hypothetical protein
MDNQLQGMLNGITLLLSFIVGHLLTLYMVASTGKTVPEGPDIVITLVFASIAYACAYTLQHISR